MIDPKKDIFIDYDIENRKLRSPIEEWHPHIAQTEKTMDWWYVTTLLHDAAGNPYFLFWCDFQFAGKKQIELIPGLAPHVKSGQKVFNTIANLTDYSNKYHVGATEVAVMDEKDSYDLESNSLLYKSENRQAKWSYDGKTSNLLLKTELFDADLTMLNADYIMYAKDKYNTEGFMQEGNENEFSFYWSLPRLLIIGKIAFTDKNGNRKEIDVTGQGWIDRQWGDFLAKTWEWTSMRFNNGARVNLYNFDNGYQVGTYQKADGSCEWFDNFIIRQNGYCKTPSNYWFSWGWSYEFPIEIEGAKKYTVDPFSSMDIVDDKANRFYEGPGKLYNDETGEVVGITIVESMDIKVMNNAPYGVNQH
jgi:predicted secreted hydrolase